MFPSGLQPLFEFLETPQTRQTPLIFAIDGGSASGKTTLASNLQKRYPCTVFHADDFFLRPEQRTAERYAEPGGNLDRERLIEEVLIPSQKGETVYLRRMNCQTLTLSKPLAIPPQNLILIEGAYSLHPDLQAFYAFTVFLDVAPEVQKQRIQLRNSKSEAQRFWEKWIPLEKRYFEHFQIQKHCDLVVPILE